MFIKSSKLKLFLCGLLVALCLVASFGLSGCVKARPVILDAPTISVDEDTGLISWNVVANARGYLIVVFNDTVDDEYYQPALDGTSILFSDAFPLIKSGQFMIKVKAVGKAPTNYDSVFSGNGYFEL